MSATVGIKSEKADALGLKKWLAALK